MADNTPWHCSGWWAPGCIFSESLADRVPKTAEYYRALIAGEEKFKYNGSSFHTFISGFMCQSGHFICYSALVAGPSTGRNLRMRISSWSIRVLTSIFVQGKCWPKHKWFPVFYLHPQDWVAKWQHVVFRKMKEGMSLAEAMEHFGSRNGKTRKMITIVNSGQL